MSRENLLARENSARVPWRTLSIAISHHIICTLFPHSVPNWCANLEITMKCSLQWVWVWVWLWFNLSFHTWPKWLLVTSGGVVRIAPTAKLVESVQEQRQLRFARERGLERCAMKSRSAMVLILWLIHWWIDFFLYVEHFGSKLKFRIIIFNYEKKTRIDYNINRLLNRL